VPIQAPAVPVPPPAPALEAADSDMPTIEVDVTEPAATAGPAPGDPPPASPPPRKKPETEKVGGVDQSPETAHAEGVPPSPATASLIPDRRQYIRVPTVVPVVYQFFCKSTGAPDAEIRTGFTQDLSDRGLCLQTGVLPATLAQLLENQALDDLGIYLDIATPERGLRVLGRIAWRQLVPQQSLKRFVVGIEFQLVSPADRAMIRRFAQSSARRPKLVRAGIGALVLVALAAVGLYAWGVTQRRNMEAALRTEIRQQIAQHEGLVANLEKQKSELDAVSKMMREVMALQEEALETGDEPYFDFEMAGDGTAADGKGQPTPIQSLKADVEKLRETIANLSTRVQELKGRQDTAKKAKHGPARKR
jgi:hypothetical protein